LSNQSRTAFTQPVAIAINSQKVIDARGFSKLIVYPSTGSFDLITSVVHDELSTAHGVAESTSSGFSAPSTIAVAGNFYLIETATTSSAPVGGVTVHSV
jgi:hypothetical protein